MIFNEVGLKGNVANSQKKKEPLDVFSRVRANWMTKKKREKVRQKERKKGSPGKFWTGNWLSRSRNEGLMTREMETGTSNSRSRTQLAIADSFLGATTKPQRNHLPFGKSIHGLVRRLKLPSRSQGVLLDGRYSPEKRPGHGRVRTRPWNQGGASGRTFPFSKWLGVSGHRFPNLFGLTPLFSDNQLLIAHPHNSHLLEVSK